MVARGVGANVACTGNGVYNINSIFRLKFSNCFFELDENKPVLVLVVWVLVEVVSGMVLVVAVLDTASAIALLTRKTMNSETINPSIITNDINSQSTQ